MPQFGFPNAATSFGHSHSNGRINAGLILFTFWKAGGIACGVWHLRYSIKIPAFIIITVRRNPRRKGAVENKQHPPNMTTKSSVTGLLSKALQPGRVE
jgi:hypothetical protein